jgi:RNA polymerase sigma factor (sigma-70 family)
LAVAHNPPAVDVEKAYRAFAGPLQWLVRTDVGGASEGVIEDACQSAWARLLDHAARVSHDRVLSWLATTARREALRLSRVDERDSSLDFELEAEGEQHSWGAGALPAHLAEQRAQLAVIATLPERQRRVLWLSILGLSRAEIARDTGWTERTVERQLLRARRGARDAWAAE